VAQETTGTEPPPGESLNPATDGYLITSDANIIHARGTLRYRIAEPGLRYTFDFLETSNLVQNAFNNALVYAAAHYTVDDALTRDVAGFREMVRARLEQLVAAYGLGASIEQIDNMQVIPPRRLAPAFAAVLEAGVKSGQTNNDARRYEAETTNNAWSEAAARVNAAENARERLVKLVAAEAQRFEDNLADYRSDPSLFLRRYQADAMAIVLTNAQDKMILPERGDGRPRELRLQLNREPEKPKTVTLERHAH
jgi:membrane protease subunit HflK